MSREPMEEYGKTCSVCGRKYHSFQTDKTPLCNDCILETWKKLHPEELILGKKGFDLSKKRFGKLEAVRPIGRTKNSIIIWECACDCGNTTRTKSTNLLHESTRSCGCLQNIAAVEKALTAARKKILHHDTNMALIASKKPRKNNKSGVPGVYFDSERGKWKAFIEFRKKRYRLGSHKDFKDAVKVRKEAEKKLHGPFLEWYEDWKKSSKKVSNKEPLNM